jgi:hypothetical protein
MADLGNLAASEAIQASLTMGVTVGSMVISAIMAFSEVGEVSSSSPDTAGGRTIPTYAPAPSGYWYYCPSVGSYYPYVDSCPEPWVPVAPTG